MLFTLRLSLSIPRNSCRSYLSGQIDFRRSKMSRRLRRKKSKLEIRIPFIQDYRTTSNKFNFTSTPQQNAHVHRIAGFKHPLPTNLTYPTSNKTKKPFIHSQLAPNPNPIPSPISEELLNDINSKRSARRIAKFLHSIQCLAFSLSLSLSEICTNLSEKKSYILNPQRPVPVSSSSLRSHFLVLFPSVSFEPGTFAPANSPP
ncbi:hypothetical protein CEXT_585901 [Caerostris extrusa]|uniref:Uncharacterized protein n=1 Tax=Caerostris extrusa TaxID=172846 RepID=A0AAV4TAW0_CAEEX|nr:hypothetical protein CEXT_585901 [Caerostris extrusa]